MTRSALPRRFAAAAVALALLAGCSSKGGTEAKTTTTKAKSTTTAVTDETVATTTTEKTTTTAGSSGEAPSADLLKGILPPSSKLGQGWKESDPPGADEELDAAVKDQCPGAVELGADPAKDVVAAYAGPSDEGLEIDFDRNAKVYDTSEFDALISSIDKCDAVTYTDADQVTYTLTFSPQRADSLGEQSAGMLVSGAVSNADGSKKIELKQYVYSIHRGTVGMTIQASDGVDTSTGKVTDFDTDLLDNLAKVLDDNLKELMS